MRQPAMENRFAMNIWRDNGAVNNDLKFYVDQLLLPKGGIAFGQLQELLPICGSFPQGHLYMDAPGLFPGGPQTDDLPSQDDGAGVAHHFPNLGVQRFIGLQDQAVPLVQIWIVTGK